MKKINVKLAGKSYPVYVGPDSVSELSGIVDGSCISGPVVVITDNVVYKHAGSRFEKALKNIKHDVVLIKVPSSEKSKSIGTYSEVMRKIARKTKKYKPLIMAFGGGVVGDLAGFIAATYRRGVPLIQVPTTLLAQVDSSIGGKVGIDLPEAKNLVGSFKQPVAVVIDPLFLSTLPLRQIRNGLGEVIKYAMIKSENMFRFLEKNMESIIKMVPGIIGSVIYECASIKASIVAKDEFDEKDIRIILNFGHTIGHAIEAASNYSGKYNHGESIAVGMLAVSEMALERGLFPERSFYRLKQLIKKYGIPVSMKNIPLNDIYSAYLHDKKFTKGGNRFLLPEKIGRVVIADNVPEKLIKKAVGKYVS